MLTLLPHPTTLAPPAVRSVQAAIIRTIDHGLCVQFVLQGTISRLNIAQPTTPQAVDNLWQHTCFELFVGAAGTTGYHEFNLSPSSEWAAYAFANYRQRLIWTAYNPPVISVCRIRGQLQLEATIAECNLPKPFAGGPLQIGVSAVIETLNGYKSYWALNHPGINPDFHNRNGFTYEIWP